jgi:predicted phosphodiesterase
MRIAVVSDIHGNLAALEAVIADLRVAAPDKVFHGGDLADGGAHPVEVVDTIRGLGWPGVLGNTDEMLFRPEALADFASGSPAAKPLLEAIGEMAAWTRDRLGPERLDWLAALPLLQVQEPMALIHASPGDPWRAPGPEADDAELERIYGVLGQPVAVYGHIHRPYVRALRSLTVANSGSVGLPYDGDPRAAYLLLDGAVPTIRRVDYELQKEASALLHSGIPHAEWTAKMLRSAQPQLP